MVELKIYRDDDLPDSLKCQILSFLRCTWPEGFTGKNRLRDWITEKEYAPLHFNLVEEGILITHVEVVNKLLDHLDKTYKIYGLTGMFTYPAFRGQGYGKQLLQTATDYIRHTDADLGMFHCAEKVVGFYAGGGWVPMRGVTTLQGDINNPEVSTETMMVLFLSNKGRSAGIEFESQSVYFGPATW